jgi:prepilin-type processing-associated H-X9-DG protein
MAGFVYFRDPPEPDTFNLQPQLTTEPTEPLATAFPGFAGGVRVASGDVNGDDDKPDLLVGRSGSDWTLDFQPELTTEPTAPAGEVNHSEFAIVKLLDAATPKLFNEDAFAFDQLADEGPEESDEGPEESITFTFGEMRGQTFDDLAVDPNNPNTEADGSNIDVNANGSVGLVVLGADTNVTGHTPEWSNLRSSDPMETPGPDDDADDGLLLPAVQDDSRSSHSGGVNVLFGDGSVRSTDTSAVATLMGFDFPSPDANGDYAGSHMLYQDVFIPALDTEPSLAIEQYWL